MTREMLVIAASALVFPASAGFHSSFRMLVLRDGAVTPVALDEWRIVSKTFQAHK